MRNIVICLLFACTCAYAESNEFVIAPIKSRSTKSLNVLRQDIAQVTADIVRICTQKACTVCKTAAQKNASNAPMAALADCLRLSKYAFAIGCDALEQASDGPLATLKKAEYARLLANLTDVRTHLETTILGTAHAPWWHTTAERIKKFAKPKKTT